MYIYANPVAPAAQIPTPVSDLNMIWEVLTKLMEMVEHIICKIGDLMDSSKTWMDTDQAANYLSLSSSALQNMTSDGHIKYYKLRRRNRYKKEDLDKLLESSQRGSEWA